MTLTRELNYRLPNGKYHHAIIGRHSYISNGQIIEESFTRQPDLPQANTLFGTPRENRDLEMGFHDLTKKKRGYVSLVIDPNNPDQLNFELTGVEGVYINRPAPPSGFTVPTHMTLTRVQ